MKEHLHVTIGPCVLNLPILGKGGHPVMGVALDLKSLAPSTEQSLLRALTDDEPTLAVGPAFFPHRKVRAYFFAGVMRLPAFPFWSALDKKPGQTEAGSNKGMGGISFSWLNNLGTDHAARRRPFPFSNLQIDPSVFSGRRWTSPFSRTSPFVSNKPISSFEPPCPAFAKTSPFSWIPCESYRSPDPFGFFAPLAEQRVGKTSSVVRNSSQVFPAGKHGGPANDARHPNATPFVSRSSSCCH